MWSSYKRVVSTALVDDVTDEMLLSVVCGENGDALRRPPHQPHVHEHRHHILRFGQILGENKVINTARL